MKNSTKKNVRLKVDFNLLMSGTWVLEKKGNQRIHYFEKQVGDGKIIIYNALDIPSPLDSKVLDYLMKISQENDWSQEIFIPTISQIIKDLKLGKRRQTVERIKKSLKILKNTHIEFHNCFIDNGVLEHFEEGTWELVSIGILEEYGFLRIKDRGNPVRVKVKFTNSFISLCRHSLGYKLIPYAPINGLRDTAYALYKWAWRWFNAEKGYGERWIGNGKKLVKWYKNELNSTANYKYPSKVLERVRSAIKQLNDNDQVPFFLELQKKNGIYKIEILRKDFCTLKREIPFDKLPKFLRDATIRLIEKKKYIKSPYALARSMSWKELEELLKKAVIIYLPHGFQEILEFSFQYNPQEKEEFKKLVLSTEKTDENFIVVAEKKILKGKNILTRFLDTIVPRWKSNTISAEKIVKGEREVELKNYSV